MPHIFNVNQKISKKIITKLEEYDNNLSNFFNIKIDKVNIFLLKTRQEMDLIYGSKTENWFVGFSRYGSIFIFDPNVYAKQSSHKNNVDFWKTLKHEYCHLYYKELTGINYPKWLNEGLACYLAEQIKKQPAREDALKVFDYFRKSDWQIYDIGYFWVKTLIEKFGREKMLALLKTLGPKTNEKNFNKDFYKIYKIRYNKEGFKKLLNY